MRWWQNKERISPYNTTNAILNKLKVSALHELQKWENKYLSAEKQVQFYILAIDQELQSKKDRVVNRPANLYLESLKVTDQAYDLLKDSRIALDAIANSIVESAKEKNRLLSKRSSILDPWQKAKLDNEIQNLNHLLRQLYQDKDQLKSQREDFYNEVKELNKKSHLLKISIRDHYGEEGQNWYALWSSRAEPQIAKKRSIGMPILPFPSISTTVQEKIETEERAFRDTQSSSNKLKIFLCHSSDDKLTVRDIYHLLRDDGFTPWLDEEELLPGQDWKNEVEKAVRNSDVILVCLSKGSIKKSGFVQKEIRIALDIADEKPEEAIFIIPAKLEDCDVPIRLKQKQWVDLYLNKGYNRLVKALRARQEQLNTSNST